MSAMRRARQRRCASIPQGIFAIGLYALGNPDSLLLPKMRASSTAQRSGILHVVRLVGNSQRADHHAFADREEYHRNHADGGSALARLAEDRQTGLGSKAGRWGGAAGLACRRISALSFVASRPFSANAASFARLSRDGAWRWKELHISRLI